MTPAKAFFDTNVLVYAHDVNDTRKRDIARRLLLDHVGAGTLCTSTQALSEYFSVVTTRGQVRLGAPAAAWLVEQLPATAVVSPGLDTVKAAVRRCSASGLAIWDALIVEAAREAGAALLYSEDRLLLNTVDEERDGILAIDPFDKNKENESGPPVGREVW
jgi:predicted nucleic acid-binding protein